MSKLSAEKLCDRADQALAKNDEGKAADQALAKNDEGKAEDYFRQALTRDPKSRRALLGVASCLISQHDFEEAQRLLNRCLYHFPGDPDALVAQARLHARQDEHAKAVAVFDQVINRDPSRREALQGKIQSLLAQGKTADAHQTIESIAPNGSRPHWLLSELGKVYIAEGAYDAAVEAFLDARAPDGLYRALNDESDKVAKARLADAIVARKPDDTQALKAVARSREASGDRGAAIEAWTKLLAVAPKDEGAHAELIRLLRMQERFDDAEAAYQSAVRSLGRSSDRLLVARARAFFDAGKRDAGIEALVQVPVSNRLLRVLGPLSDQDAAQAAEVLAERHPKNTSLLTYAARRLAHAGDRPRALELLDRALAVDPRDTDMVVAKGEILLEADRLDDLESLLKNAFLT